MAVLGGHLGFQKLDISLQRKQISACSFFKMISVLIALISYVVVILVGLTCLAVEKKMHMLISTFTKKIHFCTICTDFFCKCIIECLAQNRMRADFSFSDTFGQKM